MSPRYWEFPELFDSIFLVLQISTRSSFPYSGRGGKARCNIAFERIFSWLANSNGSAGSVDLRSSHILCWAHQKAGLIMTWLTITTENLNSGIWLEQTHVLVRRFLPPPDYTKSKNRSTLDFLLRLPRPLLMTWPNTRWIVGNLSLSLSLCLSLSLSLSARIQRPLRDHEFILGNAANYSQRICLHCRGMWGMWRRDFRRGSARKQEG